MRGELNRASFLRRSASTGSVAVMVHLTGVPVRAASAAINVGAGLIEPQAQAYYARRAGFFAQHGLDVTITTSANGAATAAAVAGGDVQVGVSSVLGLAQAHQHGLPFVIIAAGGIHDSRYPGSAVVVSPDAKATVPKDLNGKTVAVATANGLDQLITSVLVDKNGGNAGTLRFVEMKPVIMLDALLGGRIDAACMEDPEWSNARARTRSLGDGEDAIAKVFVETAWFTTRDWLAKNQDAARRFNEAIAAAGEWAMNNPVKAANVLQEDVKLQQASGKERFATSVNLVDFQVLLDAAAKYRFIQPVSAGDLVWNGK